MAAGYTPDRPVERQRSGSKAAQQLLALKDADEFAITAPTEADGDRTPRRKRLPT